MLLQLTGVLLKSAIACANVLQNTLCVHIIYIYIYIYIIYTSRITCFERCARVFVSFSFFIDVFQKTSLKSDEGAAVFSWRWSVHLIMALRAMLSAVAPWHCCVGAQNENMMGCGG